MKFTIKLKLIILTAVVAAVTVSLSVIGIMNIMNDNRIASQEQEKSLRDDYDQMIKGRLRRQYQ